MADWKNRIAKHESVPVAHLKKAAHPGNWRLHPRHQAEGVKAVMDEVGIVQNVVMNMRSEAMGWPAGSEPVLVDGHLRVDLAEQDGIAELPVVFVDLDQDEEKIVLATLDPLGEMARHNYGKLGELIDQVRERRPSLDSLIARITGNAPAISGRYTSKVESPIYEPSPDPPDATELVDSTKRDQLVADVEAAGLPPDVHAFLVSAAERHLVFDYRAIADYYASAPAEVQRLMEASALVIIDFAQAIEDGYVRLADKLRERYLVDHG